MSDLIQEESYVAEQLKDAIETEEVKPTKVNVEDDYERSKEFSTSSSSEADSNHFDSINRTGSFGNQSEKIEEGDPEKFKNMAQELSPNSDE